MTVLLSDRKLALAYIAGLLDGEGSFTTGTAGKHIALKVVNTDHALLSMYKQLVEFLGYKCGLYPHFKNGNIPKRPEWKPQWSVQLTGGRDGLVKFCIEIEPYLVGKKAQCRAVIEYLESRLKRYPGRKGTKLGRPLTEFESTKLIELKVLNHRGAKT